jgi:DNA polymerase I-like protein with 3'-5' exonuclease and polymerase domains
MKVYLDTETCGLYGMPVLLQYAFDDGPINLYEIWHRPISETLSLIESFLPHTVVGFNLAFDWFQIVKVYTTFRLCPGDWIPAEHIDEIAMLEPAAQDGPCLKPASALDLMLHSRKGPYQSLMARDDIRIRRVPTVLAQPLADELERRVELDGIYFARSADPEAPRWKVFPRKRRDGSIDPTFSDVVLKFHPAGGLKFLAEHALGFKPKFHFDDVELDKKYRPVEYGYAPTALATGTPADWKGAWPAVIAKHIEHWATHADARQYARDDIVYTRALDAHFGFPEPGDDDSILACMVPVVRWRGFRVDLAGINILREKAQAIVNSSPVNVNSAAEIRKYLFEVLDETEQVLDSTDKNHLEALTQGLWEDHPVAARARKILAVKLAVKEVQLYDKLLHAGKFHPSFVVIGALSSRMSGSDGLNAQGIKATDEVRRQFPLAWDGFELCGGDFDAFEVTLADAVFNDERLRQDLLSGKKIHALFGMALNPGKSYEDIVATKGQEIDLYDEGKRGFFGGIMYMGGWETLVGRLGKSEDVAKAAFNEFATRYKQVKAEQEKIKTDFLCVRQPGGISTAIHWHEPKDYVETFLGFRRYFTLENRICRALFDLARKPPSEWRQIPVKVQRRDRLQTACGAVSSALYGAVFGLAGAIVRAAGNHRIQSPGAQITKAAQRAVWDLQPIGVHELVVAPMNIHDELLSVTHPDYVQPVVERVRKSVESFRKHVPLIGMTWFTSMQNWAEKKAGAEPVKITYSTAA